MINNHSSMLTMLHPNAAIIEGNILRIDRKFLLGMGAYANNISIPIATVHPEAKPESFIMDLVSVPLSELPYLVLVLKTDRSGELPPLERARLQSQLAKSRLVYGGGFGSSRFCREHGIPQIRVLETDLRSQIVVSTSAVSSPLRKFVRCIRIISSYLQDIYSLSKAARLHCNGYPAYFETRFFNTDRLLYLDSRMSMADIISEADLERRLASNVNRPLRLLFSGRFEPLKGAVDCVRVGIECLRMGVDIEMHCFGQGSQSNEMKHLANESGCGKIYVHDAISFPELVERSREFDIFVCCHIQSDPSCTYLESFGSALPIVGYSNRMWRHLQRHSGVGSTAPIGNYKLLAAHVKKYSIERDSLGQHSTLARAFAVEHCFESEFKKRTDDINAYLLTGR